MTETEVVPWGAAWRNKTQAVLAIAVGLIAVVGALAFLFFYFRDSSDMAAFKSASSCASARDALNGQGCRYEGQVRVLRTSRHDRLEAEVAFDSLSDRTFATSFPNDGEPDIAALKVGGTAAGELWNAQVTRLAGKPTVGDPELYLTTPFLASAVICGILGLVISFLAVPLARAAWRPR